MMAMDAASQGPTKYTKGKQQTNNLNAQLRTWVGEKNSYASFEEVAYVLEISGRHGWGPNYEDQVW